MAHESPLLEIQSKDFIVGPVVLNHIHGLRSEAERPLQHGIIFVGL